MGTAKRVVYRGDRSSSCISTIKVAGACDHCYRLASHNTRDRATRESSGGVSVINFIG